MQRGITVYVKEPLVFMKLLYGRGGLAFFLLCEVENITTICTPSCHFSGGKVEQIGVFHSKSGSYSRSVQYPRITFPLLGTVLCMVRVVHQQYTEPTSCHPLLPGMACALYTWDWLCFMDCLWPTVLTLSPICLPPSAPCQLQVFLGNILTSCCKRCICRGPKKVMCPSTLALLDRSSADADTDSPSAPRGNSVIFVCRFIFLTLSVGH